MRGYICDNVGDRPPETSGLHCMKSVSIQSFSDPYFPTFGLNTEGYSVSVRIQSECGKIRTKKTPNTDTFHAVLLHKVEKKWFKGSSLCEFWTHLNKYIEIIIIKALKIITEKPVKDLWWSIFKKKVYG